MTKLDIAYLKCFGYEINYNYRDIYDITFKNETISYSDSRGFYYDTQWLIPIGNSKETNRIMDNLAMFIYEKEEQINKLKDLLSASDEEKKQLILNHLEELL